AFSRSSGGRALRGSGTCCALTQLLTHFDCSPVPPCGGSAWQATVPSATRTAAQNAFRTSLSLLCRLTSPSVHSGRLLLRHPLVHPALQDFERQGAPAQHRVVKTLDV